MPKKTFYNLDNEKRNRIIEAALDEFSKYVYNEVKLSNIIKASKIPRGSFYQYFEDKLDLYKYMFDIIAKKKIEFMKDLLPNPENMPFLKLFEELYIRGIKFAKSDPRLVLITRNLLMSGGTLLNEVFGDNLEVGRQFYIDYIRADKALGRIREDVDTELLADMVLQATQNIAFNEFSKGNFDIDSLFDRAIQTIKILKKGIE